MNRIRKSRWLEVSQLLQLCRFGLVGVTAVLLHFSTVVMLVQYASFSPLLANVFGFMLSFQLSYFGHRHFTFTVDSSVTHVAYLRLVIMQVSFFFINELSFYVLLLFKLPYPIALIIILTILPIFSYLFCKKWVFV